MPTHSAESDDTPPEDRAADERAFQELRSRAEAGDPQAQRDLGCAYIWGPDGYEGLVPQDYRLAREWYVRAAEQGHQEAMWDVCHMLLNGEGGLPDVELGLRYLRFLGSRRRFTIYSLYATQWLSRYYIDGEYGLPADPVLAAFWRQRERDQLRCERGEKRRNKVSSKDQRYFAKANAALQKSQQVSGNVSKPTSDATPDKAAEMIERFVDRIIGNSVWTRFLYHQFTHASVAAAMAECEAVKTSHPSGTSEIFCHDEGRPVLAEIARRLRAS